MTSILRKGLRMLDPRNDKFELILIHNFEYWIKSKLWKF